MQGDVLRLVLARLDSIDKHLQMLNGRTAKLENWKAALAGAFVVIAAIIGYLFKSS